MAKRLEQTFGGSPFLLESHEHIDIVGEIVYVASAYRIEDEGQSLRAIADHDGDPLELPSVDEDEAIARVSRYLEARFGRRGNPPAQSQARLAESVHLVAPALSDERAMTVRAASPLRKGDHVVISANTAKPIARHLIGVGEGDQLGRALEAASTGEEVRVWAFRRRSQES